MQPLTVVLELARPRTPAAEIARHLAETAKIHACPCEHQNIFPFAREMFGYAPAAETPLLARAGNCVLVVDEEERLLAPLLDDCLRRSQVASFGLPIALIGVGTGERRASDACGRAAARNGARLMPLRWDVDLRQPPRASELAHGAHAVLSHVRQHRMPRKGWVHTAFTALGAHRLIRRPPAE